MAFKKPSVCLVLVCPWQWEKLIMLLVKAKSRREVKHGKHQPPVPADWTELHTQASFAFCSFRLHSYYSEPLNILQGEQCQCVLSGYLPLLPIMVSKPRICLKCSLTTSASLQENFTGSSLVNSPLCCSQPPSSPASPAPGTSIGRKDSSSRTVTHENPPSPKGTNHTRGSAGPIGLLPALRFWDSGRTHSSQSPRCLQC